MLGVLRFKAMPFFLSIIITINVECIQTEDKLENNSFNKSSNINKCPFSKIIEDIFKVHNKSSETGIYLEDSERAKEYLNSLPKSGLNVNKSIHENLVNNIIASINKIKNNITADRNNPEAQLNEAIILNTKPTSSKVAVNNHKTFIKIDDKLNLMDNIEVNQTSNNINSNNSHTVNNNTNDTNSTKTYVEVLTIEPNNTSNNTSPLNIIEMLKHLMPLFNSTITKELHNVTIIERNSNRNNSFSATKNISTIVITYCDKDNLTKSNTTYEKETILKDAEGSNDDYLDVDDSNRKFDEITSENDNNKEVNLTTEEKRDILEATEYGMQKMHELYSIMEPKLYSMGLWLDETDPARYVAAFNAPSEEAAKFSRYGYASLHAAAKLKELTGGGNTEGLESRTEETQFPSASALRQSPLIEHCPLKGAPKCPPASKRYRTHDGTCNNINRPRWGSTMTPVQRFLPPSYSDGIQAPRRSIFGSKLPSAREISTTIHESKDAETESVTHLLMQWGQFVDHDITSSSQSRGFNGSVPRCCKDGGRDFVPREFMHPECLPIAVPSSDPFYGPRGVRCLDFVRSSPAPRDDCALGWREQMNQVSTYIDASPLYGSSARQSDKLRLFRNGMLQYGRVQQRRPLLPPERRDELCRGGAVSTECFKSGDGRVNEHPGLVAAHIVWLRQHNRMAQELAHLNPHWSDEKIYQETRKIVGAMVQHITYKEFLPIVLGSEVMRLFDLEPLRKGFYRNYNPKTNPSPASSFGSAAFRFGHSLVQPSMVRFDRFHRPINNNVSLHDEPTNPSNIWSIGAVDRLMLGMVNQPIQKRDQHITEELTNHLFQTPQVDFGMDLAAINIQRGRDHGVAPYTAWREPCGLTAINDFEDLFRVMPSRTVRNLQDLYRHVDDIDLFTGGISERPVVGGLVGPTFACIIAQQFSNLRKGDRFWYENGGFDSSFTPAQLQQVRRITFAQVLCKTLDNVDNIQPFVLLTANDGDNKRLSCSNGLLNNFDLSPWTEIDNDIGKAEDITKPPSTKAPTTSTSKTSTVKSHKKPQKTSGINNSNKIADKRKPITSITNNTKPVKKDDNDKAEPRLNKTDATDLVDTMIKDTLNNTNHTQDNTLQKIDDKLDFKNKSRRYDNIQRSDDDQYIYRRQPTGYYNDYDYEEYDNNHSQQEIIINNLSYKRPSHQHHHHSYKRPVISVTENVDRFTYLINYVPKPTPQPWRKNTKPPYKEPERDIVKVTYQTYDNTYNRRPNRPYFSNREEERPKDHNKDEQDYKYRDDKPDKYTTRDEFPSSRTNDFTTAIPMIIKKTDTKIDSTTTTDNYKLVTFRYVGTYKGHEFKDKNEQDQVKTDNVQISKDFSTYNKKEDISDMLNAMKLSTFYHYDTATRPYNLDRPQRRNDDDNPKGVDYVSKKDKYYYVRNVLHKYPDIHETMTETRDEINKDFVKENYNNPGVPEGTSYDTQERSSVDKLAFLEEVESAKSANPEPKKNNAKPLQSAAKTPLVAFQVIPSENWDTENPTMWAFYEEKSDQSGVPHEMPAMQSDPYALKELPRPMSLNSNKKNSVNRKFRY